MEIETTMVLKELPPNFYDMVIEKIYTLSPDKVYMVKQTTIAEGNCLEKYFFRLPTERNVYESLITRSLYDGILTDIYFKDDEIKILKVCKYLYGKDTVKVICEYDKKLRRTIIYAVGPEDNAEWQTDFQKYHI